MAEAPATSKPKTQLRAKKRNILDSNAPEVVAIIAGGDRPSDIARLYGVAPSSITRFTERHAAAIAAMRTEVIKQVEDYYIAHKVNRIAALDKLYRLMDAEVDEDGLAVTEVRHEYRNGEQVAEVETRDFRGSLVREMRGVLKDAADELGQIPRPDVHNTVNVGILVRQLSGYDPEAIG